MCTKPDDSSTFDKEFQLWLGKVLPQSKRVRIAGFSFNLFEYPRNEKYSKSNPKFGVELIGSSMFDEVDSDWACEECWEANPRGIEIPIEISGKDWEGCLQKMQSLISKTLKSDLRAIKILNSAKGVGVGFVDGDLILIK